MELVGAGVALFLFLLIVGVLLRPAKAASATRHRRAADVADEALAADDTVRREEELVETAGRIRTILDQLDDLIVTTAERQDSATDSLSGTQERIRRADGANIESLRHMLLSEVDQVIGDNRELARELRSSRKIMRDQHERLDSFRTAARVDPLTGVGNRSLFDEALGRLSAEAAKSGAPLSLIMIDLDHFKNVNDEHGHQVGDRTLAGVARLFRSRVRGRDIVARYGGEEFGILLPDTPLADALHVAEDIRNRAECTRINVDSLRLTVTLSLGVAQLVPPMKATELVRLADAALYRAKHDGRNRVRAHAPE